MMKITVLFVDDEDRILQALKRMLRTMRQEWDMVFAQSGEEALRLMAGQSVDVLVTDMKMPGMDGAQLIEAVTRQYPETIRIILSGQASNEAFFKSIGCAHQFLSKPTDDITLKKAIQRAFTLRDILQNRNISNLTTEMDSIPSLPTLYADLMKELESPEPSMQVVGEIIEKDVGMSARILQVVNSAFYGLRRIISNPSKAVLLLGLENIRSLVLMVHVFSAIDNSKLPSDFSAEGIWEHSAEVSNLAKRIAQAENPNDKSGFEAQSAGLLHDVGQLILASNPSAHYDHVLDVAKEESIPIFKAEMKVLGATHAEIGAYLLGLWGLPSELVEAVAYHHNPCGSGREDFSTSMAVHIANAFANADESMIDQDCLKSLGLFQRLEHWREICENAITERESNEND
jgi:putative nucleotidyltransferase with HDIG domain